MTLGIYVGAMSVDFIETNNQLLNQGYGAAWKEKGLQGRLLSARSLGSHWIEIKKH